MQQRTWERRFNRTRIYPVVDPLASTSSALTPEIVGEEHYEVAMKVQQMLQRYRELQDIIAILGIDELSDSEKLLETVQEEFNSSYHKTSTLLKPSQDNLVHTFQLKIRFADLKELSMVYMMIFQKICSVT